MDNETSFSDNSTPAFGQTSPGANGSATGLKREMQDLAADLGDLVKTTTGLAGDDLARAKSQLESGVASVKASLGKFGDQIASRGRSTALASDNYVHQYPWKAIGIGAALGVLIGFVLAARRG